MHSAIRKTTALPVHRSVWRSKERGATPMPLFLTLSTPMATAATRLLEQADVVDDHRLIMRLRHVVDGDEAHRNRGQGLHLHARASHRARRRLYPNTRKGIVEGQSDLDVRQRQRMTHRDQLRCAFRSHNSRDLR